MVIETEKVQNEMEVQAFGFLHIIVEQGNTRPVGEILAVLVESKGELQTLQQGVSKGVGPAMAGLEEAGGAP